MPIQLSPITDLDKIQAHRGASAVAPENTLAAFRAAAEQGARWVELDVALSRDGALVVIHDDSVDRTTSGAGSLGELTLAQMKELDAGAWFDPRFTGERLPTLEEALAELARLGVGANIEIKQHKHHSSLQQLIDMLTRAIESRPPGAAVMISSFDPEALRAVGKVLPDIERAILWSRLPADWQQQVADIPAQAIHIHFKEMSLAFVEAATRLGLKARAWTCNDPVLLASFWPAGLAGVITDDPSLYLA